MADDDQEFDSTLKAWRKARAIASAAQTIEGDLLQCLIYDARDVGMSIRQVAGVLGVPKSTVARHWKRKHQDSPPLWADEETWEHVEANVWSHDPARRNDVVPYEWAETPDGNRMVRTRPIGTAVRIDHTTKKQADQ